MVLKVAPPLVVQPGQIDKFVRSIREVVDLAHHSGEFWSEALGLAMRAMNVRRTLCARRVTYRPHPYSSSSKKS
jgi:hypothetical protein